MNFHLVKAVAIPFLTTAVICAGVALWGGQSERPGSFFSSGRPAQSEAPDFERQVKIACTQCHNWPRPEILPRRQWQVEVNRMFSLANFYLYEKYGKPMWDLDSLAVLAVTRYFETRAPAELDTPPWIADSESKLHFRLEPYDVPDGVGPSGIANVHLLDLFKDSRGPEIVVCDMLSGYVFWVDPRSSHTTLHPLARLLNPAHSELVDLDQDGQTDLLIADLGQPLPSDETNGQVVLLRRSGEKQFDVVPLASGLGRVADARAADFDGDGDLDVVVAEFGWRRVGELLYLEHVSEDGPSKTLKFKKHSLDTRTGAIHVPIVDLNEDGQPDILVLLSQEHETVSAFINRGDNRFDLHDLHVGAHPHLGSTGIELVDLDRDGDLDILLTQGDTMDDDVQFKPYHGVLWLENKGNLTFAPHFIDTYYGAHRANAIDLDGDGDLDIVASSLFIPGLQERERRERGMYGIVWYEQTSPGIFRSHVLADTDCAYATLDVGDVNADGLPDVVAGILRVPPEKGSVVHLWIQEPPATVERF